MSEPTAAELVDDPLPGEARWLGDPLRRVKKLVLLSQDFSDREKRDFLGWMADAVKPCGDDPWQRVSVSRALVACAQLVRLDTKSLLIAVDSPESLRVAQLSALWGREFEKFRRLSGMKRSSGEGHHQPDTGSIYSAPRERAPSELAAADAEQLVGAA